MTATILWALVLFLFGANGDLRRVVSTTKVICRNAITHRHHQGENIYELKMPDDRDL